MARAMTINEVAEHLRAVHVARLHDDPGYRVVEIREATGLSVAKINAMIAAGLKEGTVRRSSRLIERNDGRWTPVTTYVFLGEAK